MVLTLEEISITFTDSNTAIAFTENDKYMKEETTQWDGSKYNFKTISKWTD